MTSPQAEPSAQVNQRLDRAGLRGDLDLAARFEELAQTVADALDAAAPRGPAAPYWIGLDRHAFGTQLAELRRWADTVLRQHYSGYELRDCWSSHIHAGRRMASRLRRPARRSGPRLGVLRLLAARHYASNRGHHPHLPAGMHHASPLLVTDLHWQSAHRDQTLSQPAEARLFVLRYDHRQPGRRFPSDELRTTS